MMQIFKNLALSSCIIVCVWLDITLLLVAILALGNITLNANAHFIHPCITLAPIASYSYL